MTMTSDHTDRDSFNQDTEDDFGNDNDDTDAKKVTIMAGVVELDKTGRLSSQP